MKQDFDEVKNMKLKCPECEKSAQRLYSRDPNQNYKQVGVGLHCSHCGFIVHNKDEVFLENPNLTLEELLPRMKCLHREEQTCTLEADKCPSIGTEIHCECFHERDYDFVAKYFELINAQTRQATFEEVWS